jgi:hypothetical protein
MRINYLKSAWTSYPNTIGPIANPNMNILVPAPTMVSTGTPNSLLVTIAAGLNTLDANVVVSTYSAIDIVMSHLRHRGKFCGFPASPSPYQSTRYVGPLIVSRIRSSKAASWVEVEAAEEDVEDSWTIGVLVGDNMVGNFNGNAKDDCIHTKMGVENVILLGKVVGGSVLYGDPGHRNRDRSMPKGHCHRYLICCIEVFILND